MQVKKQQLELHMESGSKLGKEDIKAANCYPACLTYMQNTSYEMPDWMKLESTLPGEITSDTQMMSLLWQKVKN